MRVMEAVIRRTLFDNPEAVARVMTVARTQLDAHIAAGRNIRPAMVRDAAPSIRHDVVRGRDPATPPNPRHGPPPKPPERHRPRCLGLGPLCCSPSATNRARARLIG